MPSHLPSAFFPPLVFPPSSSLGLPETSQVREGMDPVEPVELQRRGPPLYIPLCSWTISSLEVAAGAVRPRLDMSQAREHVEQLKSDKKRLKSGEFPCPSDVPLSSSPRGPRRGSPARGSPRGRCRGRRGAGAVYDGRGQARIDVFATA